jgi:hypothetical protein
MKQAGGETKAWRLNLEIATPSSLRFAPSYLRFLFLW